MTDSEAMDGERKDQEEAAVGRCYIDTDLKHKSLEIVNQSQNSLPETFYVFVDPANLIATHNLAVTGGWTSAAIGQMAIDPQFIEKFKSRDVNYLPFRWFPTDIQVLTPFVMNVTSEYRVEYDAELHRQEFFPTAPSRFSAIFAFGDCEACEKVHTMYKWDIETVRKFSVDPQVPSSVSKCNMQIVSAARDIYRRIFLSAEKRKEIWDAYWLCKPFENIEVLPEFLIEGRIKLHE